VDGESSLLTFSARWAAASGAQHWMDGWMDGWIRQAEGVLLQVAGFWQSWVRILVDSIGIIPI